MSRTQLTACTLATVALASVVISVANLGTVTQSVAQPLSAAQTGAEKIVMTCQSEIGGQTDICLMNPDGSAFERLTDTASSERSPAFSPDGERIA